ncbi:MAG: hypothetical protein ACI80N_001551, partial [Gammaproteobacteria bacterium]
RRRPFLVAEDANVRKVPPKPERTAKPAVRGISSAWS